jgi:ribosomal protein S21
MINIEVDKNASESNVSLLRRFTKKVQGSGILPKVRSIRYATRKLSPYKLKKSRLVSISRKAEIEELIKMGKMTPKEERKRK